MKPKKSFIIKTETVFEMEPKELGQLIQEKMRQDFRIVIELPKGCRFEKTDDEISASIVASYSHYKLLWIIIGLPRILYWAIKNWIKRDRKWCKSQGIGFKRILKNEWRLYLGLMQTDNDKES